MDNIAPLRGNGEHTFGILKINISLPIRFRYLADKTDADYMRANAAKLKLQFKNYDWSTFAVDSK